MIASLAEIIEVVIKVIRLNGVTEKETLSVTQENRGKQGTFLFPESQ